MIQTIKADIKEARLNKDTAKLSTLKLLLAELEKEKVKLKLNVVEDLVEDQVITVINRSLKALDKEITAFKEVGRTVEKQESEKALLMNYLPKQLSEEEVLKIIVEIADKIKETGGKIGDAMKEISALLRGKTDMKKVSELVKKQF
ncbi:GatB/YgeY domain-containing protein [Bacillus phage vB_BanS-Thrax1]|nr:GatB/YgeY domain-containing protein [Bacillus phage vB_BanS-Thrax1]